MQGGRRLCLDADERGWLLAAAGGEHGPGVEAGRHGISGADERRGRLVQGRPRLDEARLLLERRRLAVQGRSGGECWTE